MPGFGSGPFGQGAFGEFDWSRRVLFQSMPELYRLSDLEQDGVLEAYSDAIGISYDLLRRKIREFGDLRDPLLVRTQYDEVLPIKLGRRIELLGPVEQRGVQASVDAVQAFVTQRGRFTAADLGKELAISGSTLPGNNRTVRVARLVGPKTLFTDPPLATDPGPLTWTIRVPDQTPVGEVRVEVASGNMDLVAPGWLVRDGRTEVSVLARTQFKFESDEQVVLTDQEGADGFLSTGIFNAPSAAFNQEDVGRRFTISGSVNVENNGKFEITAVLSPTSITLDSADLVPEDGGPLVWALLKRAEITLQGPAVVAGLVEQSGADGTTTFGTGDFTALSGRFTTDDIGKLLTVRVDGSLVNDLLYEVTAIVSLSAATVTPDFPTTHVGAFWELRSRTGLGDGTDLEARATSLLRHLAKDFGAPLDTREDEEFQRRWVASLPRWNRIKGTENGYKFLGALTGYDVSECNPMYRVSFNVYVALGVISDVFIVSEGTTPGRSGATGSLTTVGSRVRFSAPTALFATGDEGRHIHIVNSGSGNDGVVGVIDSVVSPTTVEFESDAEVSDLPAVPVPVTSPDANNGTLEWMIVRLYAEETPLLPVLDMINTDRMTELKGAIAFVADKYCFEVDWSSTLGPGDSADGVIFLDSVDPATASALPVVYTVQARGDFDVVVGIGEGKWKLTDSAAIEHFIETVPAQVVDVTLSGETAALGPDRIQTAGATFVASDLYKRITITSAANPANEGDYIISAVNSATEVELDPSYSTLASAGSVDFFMWHWEFTAIATVPPVLGAATLEYLCPEITSCDYCRSNKVRIRATTTLALEKGPERLFDRLFEVKPKHVEIVDAFGVEATGTFSVLVTVTTP